MSQIDAWHMARNAHDVGRQTTLRKCANTRADKPPEMTINKEVFDMYLFECCASSVASEQMYTD